MPLVELKSVGFAYGSGTGNALRNIDLSLAPGDYLAIVGSNGSGKSTLLKLMAGLARPDSGSVLIGGTSISPASDLETRSRIALVFQSPADQIVSSIVEDDVAFGCENLGLAPSEIELRIGSSLAAVGLDRERRTPTRFLSAGQQQRLAIAGALAMRPSCIAFDEATAMLDPEARMDVLSIMDRLVADGLTVVHVTHDMSEAARAGRLVVLSAGALVYEGSPRDFFETRNPDEFGLDFPPEVRFASALGLAPIVGEVVSGLAARLRKSFDGGDAHVGNTRFDPQRVPGAGNRGSDPGGAGDTLRAGDEVFGFDSVSFSWLKGRLNEKLAVDRVSFSIPRGSLVAFVGRTGSGKSSVLSLMNALSQADSGQVRTFGLDARTGLAKPAGSETRRAARGRSLSLFRPRTRAAQVNPVRALRLRAPLAIQRPETALFEFHSGDDVAFGPRNLGLAGKALVDRVSAWMNSFGLPFADFRDRPTRSLSGGEKRKLALAGVFAMESEAILLDEPGSALDPPTRRSVLGLISASAGNSPEGSRAAALSAGRQNTGGRTIVMATHSMEEAAMASLVGVFSEGRLVAFDTPGRVFGALYDPSWGIARPYAAELALALGLSGADGSLPLDLEGLVAVLSGGDHAWS